MKKIILLSLLFLAFSSAFAQATTTRFGATKNSDNTGRVLTYAVITTTDLTSATIDTVLFAPGAWETEWRPSANLADSCVIKFSSTTTSYRVGDTFTAFLSKGSGNGRFRMGGSKYILGTANSTGVALAANKSCIICFRWNGTKWIEAYRIVEP